VLKQATTNASVQTQRIILRFFKTAITTPTNAAIVTTKSAPQTQGRRETDICSGFAERYRPAMLGGGATGASAAGVPLTGIRSGGWFGGVFLS
jgi:hypothetical protein